MAVLLFSLLTNHGDCPICLHNMRCTLNLPQPLYNCITVDMLFNIVGHKIDGNYESWKYVTQIKISTNHDQIGIVGHEDSVLRSCRLHYCLRNQQVGILLRVFCEASSKLQVVTQHVDEVLFVGDVRKDDTHPSTSSTSYLL